MSERVNMSQNKFSKTETLRIHSYVSPLFGHYKTRLYQLHPIESKEFENKVGKTIIKIGKLLSDLKVRYNLYAENFTLKY